MKTLWVFVLLALVVFSASAEEVLCDKQCKLEQVEIYFNNIDRVFKQDSSQQDIEAFIAHVHDEVKYQHPEYGADFNKKSWREAFLKQLQLGSYDSGPKDEARILNAIDGKQHMAVEYSYGKKQADGSWQAGKPFLALFGFKDGKISLVREYW